MGRFTRELAAHVAERRLPGAVRSPQLVPDLAAGKPEQSVVLVGLTKEEAEERAKRWREEQT